MQRTADVWKKRYILEFYGFIRSPKVHKIVKPLFKDYVRDPADHTLAKMMVMLEFLMDDISMSEVARKAVLSFYATAPLNLNKAVEQIEPITIKQTKQGTRLDVAEEVTQSDLLEFVKLKYSKEGVERLHIKARLREIITVDRRINKRQSYTQIQDEISDVYSKWIDDGNLRTIVSNHQKRIK